MRRVQIAVIGYNGDMCTDAAREAAYKVGSEIAKAGAVLVCGGLGGVMEEACRGAKESGGTTVGIIPQDDFCYANKYCDIVVCSTIGFARDFMVAGSADGIIAVGGGVGTLIELSAGYMMKKPMAAVKGSGGTADLYAGKYLDVRKRAVIIMAASAKEAVENIMDKIKEEKNNDAGRGHDSLRDKA
ncbi:MAG TPA: TIGR00725 family protein [Nitrososphaera sp.]|nr:TIGR00725 family protein [Nitrososphaera sp.]